MPDESPTSRPAAPIQSSQAPRLQVAPTVAVSIDGRIAEDKTCRECGYNLRGLQTDGRCPECGGEVTASLLGHDLLYASIPWLKTISRGFRYMRNAILFLFLAIFLLSLFIVIAQVSGIPNSIDDSFRSLMIETAEMLALFLAAGFMGYGLILATRVEPRFVFRREGFSVRRALRLLIFLTLSLWTFVRIVQYAGEDTGLIVFNIRVLSPALAVLGPLTIALLLKHVINLLDRTAEKNALSIIRHASRVAYCITILAGMVFLLQTLVLITDRSPRLARLIHAITEPLDTCGSVIRILLLLSVLKVIWQTHSTLQHIANDVEIRDV